MLKPLGVFEPAQLFLSKGHCVDGDLVEIDRILYTKWAVYVGNGEVVHLSEPVNGHAVVERCSLEKAAQDCLVRVNDKEVPAKERRLTPLPPETVVENALKAVGRTIRHNIVIRNSEHFVTQLKYGVGWSDQAKAMQGNMSVLSPAPSSPMQVEQAHKDIWGELHSILSSSPPSPPVEQTSP